MPLLAAREQSEDDMKSSILLVEDHAAERLRLESMLSKIGYPVECAQNGLEALKMLDHQPYDIIISDWKMPELDGLNLCRAVREEERFGYPYFIMLTGFDSKADLIAGMDAGADDFITKPFNAEELRVRLQAGDRIQQLKHQLQTNNDSLEKAYNQLKQTDREMQKDLDIAAYMQKAMLPEQKNLFASWSMSSLYRPAGQVSGDAFNVFKLGSDMLGFYHVDVSGHGVSAAMLSFTLARFLGAGDGAIDQVEKGAAIDDLFPVRIVNELNKRFQPDQLHSPYFTMVYGIINVETGEGSLCQAGHPHPLILCSSGEVKRLGSGGFPVGTLEDAKYTHTAFRLSAGDRLLTYSDGITEAASDDGKQLGEQQLISLLSKAARFSPEECMRLIDNVLSKWQKSSQPNDDISAMMLGFNTEDAA